MSIQKPNDYFIGALIPDIRYFADVPREQTHFSADLIPTYAGQASASFLTGYMVHLLLDEVWPTLESQYRDDFPSAVRNKLGGNRCQIAYEVFCLAQQPIQLELSPLHNPMLMGLGISAENVCLAAEVMQEYLDTPSLTTAFGIAKRAGVFPAHRLDDVASIVNSIERYRLLKWIVARIVRKPSATLFPQLLTNIQTRVNEIGLNNKTADLTSE
ncbi:MAG: hypothetical protein ACPG8W_03265 [Candidatus Promineifilaceae bacterium]